MTPSAGAERVLALQGGRNFRDLGGYRAQSGVVRRGMVFRSGSLHRLTAADLATVEALRLRVVYDLRADEEREVAPSVLPDGVRCEWLPIRGDAAKTQDLTDLLMAGRLGELPPDFLPRIYAAMVEAAAPTFGQLLRGLAGPDGLPALIHCTAGKDRTGMAAALLLSVLGVDDADVLDDYELSAEHYTERRLARQEQKLIAAGVSPDHYRTVFGAPRAAMAAVLEQIRERHGSVEGYLRDEAGVGADVIEELRRRLVDH